MSTFARTVAIGASAALLGAGSLVAAAAPASAMPLTVDCATIGGGGVFGSIDNSIALTIQVSTGYTCQVSWVYTTGYTASDVTVTGPSGSIAAGVATSITTGQAVTITNTDPSGMRYVDFTFSRVRLSDSASSSAMQTYELYGAGGGGGPSASSEATGVSIRQGRPIPASGLCTDVVDAEYAYGTGLSGGWQRGWEPWVNPQATDDARWGWACIRTLVNRGSGWIIENS